MSDTDTIFESGDTLDIIVYVLIVMTTLYTLCLMFFLPPVIFAGEGSAKGAYLLLIPHLITLVMGVIWIVRHRNRIAKKRKLEELQQKTREEEYKKRLEAYRKFKIRLFRFSDRDRKIAFKRRI